MAPLEGGKGTPSFHTGLSGCWLADLVKIGSGRGVGNLALLARFNPCPISTGSQITHRLFGLWKSSRKYPISRTQSSEEWFHKANGLHVVDRVLTW